MMSKEIFLCIIAFCVLVMTFGLVAITADHTEKSAREPAPRLSKDSENNPIHKDLIPNSTGHPEKADPHVKPKRTPSSASSDVTNNHPRTPKTNPWPSHARRARSEIKERLTPVESNGRVYLENTSGVEAIVGDEEDEAAVEIVE